MSLKAVKKWTLWKGQHWETLSMDGNTLKSPTQPYLMGIQRKKDTATHHIIRPLLSMEKWLEKTRKDQTTPKERKQVCNLREENEFLTRSTSPAASHSQLSSPPKPSRTRQPRFQLCQIHSRHAVLSQQLMSCRQCACAGSGQPARLKFISIGGLLGFA